MSYVLMYELYIDDAAEGVLSLGRTLVERGSNSQMLVSGFGTELVVATT